MHLQLLFENMDKADATTRIFLIRFLQRFGVSGFFDLRIKDLVKELGIHDKSARSSLEFLVKHQYLQIAEIKKGNRGRPKRVIGVGVQVNLLLEGKSEQSLRHAGLINKLLMERLSWKKVGDVKQAVGLKNTERLLMAVLYAHADHGGQVAEIGFSKLSDCTGLNSSQLRRCIGTLKHQKLISVYEPGRLARTGAKQDKGRYLLRLEELFNSPINKLTIDINIDLLDEFARSFLLAYALVVTKGRDVTIITKEERQHWLDIYRVREDWYTNLEKCLIFFEDRGFHGRKLENMYRLLCSAISHLLMNSKENRSSEIIGDFLRRHGGLRSYTRRLNNEEVNALICFLSKVVEVLYLEVEKRLNMQLSSVTESRMNNCSVKMVGPDSIEILYRVKPDDFEGE